MSVPQGRIARLACNQISTVPLLDLLSGETIEIPRGADMRIQGALFNGIPSADTFVTDLSNIVSIELAVRKHNVRGQIMVSKLQMQTQIQNSTYAAWLDGTGQQFEFVLDESQTSWEVLDAGSLPIFYTLSVLTNTALYTAGRGYGKLVDVGLVDVEAPFLPSNYVTLTPTESSATFVDIVRGHIALHLAPTTTGADQTHNLYLPILNLLPGSLVDLFVELPADANITVNVYNENIGGTLLHTVVGDQDNPTYQRVVFRFDMANATWVKFGPAES